MTKTLALIQITPHKQTKPAGNDDNPGKCRMARFRFIIALIGFFHHTGHIKYAKRQSGNIAGKFVTGKSCHQIE